MSNYSRRALLLSGSALALSSAASAQSAASKTLTTGQVLERIKTNIGVPWRQQTVDNLIAGTPETPVRGIATTMMATLDVAKRALAAGKNMIITHESTFFSHQDALDQLEKDETYLFKRDFLNKNEMSVLHFHDHWHARRPDGINAGMARELGWEKNVDAQNPRIYHFPGTPLARLAKDVQSKLNIRTMRVVGDPKLPVNNVFASWGNISQFPGIPWVARPDVDVLICGETREWELVEYVQDAVSSGKKKALIVMGHVVSEQSGMKLCADWLKPLFPEIPVEFIAAAEPFWNPDNPVA